MRRLFFVLTCLCFAVAPANATKPGAAPRTTVMLVWTVADPQSSLADVQCLDVALRAPFEIGAPARALRAHAGARFAIALSPAYATALACAGGDPLDAARRATGERADLRTRDLLTLLAMMPPLSTDLAATPGARELKLLAVTAQRWLAGDATARINQDDLRRGVALASAARSATAGAVAARSLLAQPPTSTAVLYRSADDIARSTVNGAVGASRDALARGALEIVGAPAGDPVLPLLVDSGGKTMSDPSVVQLNAAADATALIDDALAVAARRDSGHVAGLLAPFGAYDDAAAQLIAARGARYAIFSDRVLQTSQAGGSVAALRAAQASSYLLYALQTGKQSALPVFFWDDGASRALDALSMSLPTTAFAARVAADAAAAASTSFDGSARVLVLRVQMAGQWAQRPEADVVVERVAADIARSDGAATPSGYVGTHHAMTSAYGFAPGSTLGALDAFTGLPNQSAMWSALAAARDAAGGDAVLRSAEIRTPLLRAESGAFYLTPLLPLTPERIKERVDVFRALLMDVYKAAGKRVPATIAPMRVPSPAPIPLAPSPKPSATLSTGPVNMWRTGV